MSISAAALLRLGIARYAAGELVPRAHERTGFAGGARWMARAMGVRLDDASAKRAARLGLWKYGLSLASALALGAVACRLHAIVGAFAFVLAFYAVEVQGLFLVPLVALGEAAPLRRSRMLVTAEGGTLRVVAKVLPIAAWMVLAGPFRGFARAWCEGCLAVLVWFESAREGGARHA